MIPDHDDELQRFLEEGAELSAGVRHHHAVHDGATLWWGELGEGHPLVLLHGGLGHSGNWARVLPYLAGHRLVLMDTRGHGRSTRDARPYSYGLLAEDVRAVLDGAGLARASLLGWSDGACTALELARRHPERVESVVFFACNVDSSGTLPFDNLPPRVDRCFQRHRKDYQTLSGTPGAFDSFVADVGLMQRTQPEYSVADLRAITTPVTVVHAENDEFIRKEHARYLVQTLPSGRWIFLPGVSHFAPLQRPELFAQAVHEALRG